MKDQKEFTVTASVQLTCEMTFEAEDANDAQRQMGEYLDVSSNFESEYFKRIGVSDYEFDDVSEG